MNRKSRGVANSSPGPASSPPVDALPRLGPKSRTMLAGIGIKTAEQLRARDPFEVYAELKAAHAGVSLNMLYGLIGAVENRPWRDVARDDRTSILLRLEDMGLLQETPAARQVHPTNLRRRRER